MPGLRSRSPEAARAPPVRAFRNAQEGAARPEGRGQWGLANGTRERTAPLFPFARARQLCRHAPSAMVEALGEVQLIN